MLLAVDVDYKNDSRAVAAGVVFRAWSSGTIEAVVHQDISAVRPYQPGRFFERELPCILALLETYSRPVETIIIDGYVYLGSDRRDGLGACLFDAL
ncbi:MAG: endonuclease V, partial [Pseudomonadota bacterium]